MTTEDRLIPFFAAILTGAIFFTALIYGGDYWLSIPDVHFSTMHQKCVKIVPHTAGTCDDLPRRYGVVWVQ